MSKGPLIRRWPGRRVVLVLAFLVALGGAAGLAWAAVGQPKPAPGAAAPAPRFVDEAATAGLDHRYEGEFPFFVGGGVAAVDCDDDGRQDLYLAGGAEPAALFRNESTVGGALRFRRVPDPATDLTRVTGAYPLDIDGDAHADLAVLRSGENVLLRGLGDCHFERANETWGYDGGSAWTTAFSATWENNAPLPTLAFGNYLPLDESGEPGPITGDCATNDLVRPAAGSYDRPAVLSPGWCTLSMLFSDWSHSGRRDLRVSNDRHYYPAYSGGEEQLWRVAAGEESRLYTREEGWQAVRIWGMGIASQDITGDGYPEVYLTSQTDNKLQTLADGPSRPTYRDIGLERNATAHKPYAGDTDRPSTAWHAEFDDVNNDGYMDLFVAKGNVEAMPDYAMRDPSNLLLGGPDGSFTEGAEAAGIVTFARGRGAALVDLNLDGLLDLVQVNRRVQVGVWRNVGSGDAGRPAPMGNWVAVRLIQPGPNVDAIGSWIELRAGDRTTTREVTVGGGHAGGQLGWVHVGLGGAERPEVRVTWPDGEVGPWIPLSPNAFAIVERDASEARTWSPG